MIISCSSSKHQQRWSGVTLFAVLGMCLVLAEAASTARKEGFEKDGATSTIQKDTEVNPMCVKPPPVPNAFLSIATQNTGGQQGDLPNGNKITFFSVGDSVTYHCLPGYVSGRGQTASPVLRVKCTESKDGTPVWAVRGRCNPIPPGGPAVQDLFYPHERRKVQSDAAGTEDGQAATSAADDANNTQLQQDDSSLENDRGHKRRYSKRPGFYSGQSAKRFASGRLNEPDEEIAAIEELPIEISIKAADCSKDGSCRPRTLPDPMEGRITRKLKIANKFHSPFHQFGIVEVGKQHLEKHHPMNLLYEPPDMPKRYTGSRWARHHPRLPPPVCDGPACDIGDGGEQLALSIAQPDFETRYPDSTEDVLSAALARTAAYREPSGNYELLVGELGPDPWALHGSNEADCQSPKCKNKEKKQEKELPDKYKKGIAKPYSEEEVTQKYEPEPVEPNCGKEPCVRYRPVAQPPGPPCDPHCRDGKNCCGFTEEGEVQGQYNPEFEELTAAEGPYYPRNYKVKSDTANDDDDDCDAWLDWFLEPRNVLKMVTGLLAVGFAIHLLRCLLCQATPEEGGLEHDSSSGANCAGAWNLLGDKSCAAAAVDDDSDDGCATDKCGPC